MRLRHYAPRVQRVLFPRECGNFPLHRVHPYSFANSILTEIASHFLGKPLLHNIRVLHASPNHGAEVFYRAFPVLFGPKLRKIQSAHHSRYGKLDDELWTSALRQIFVLLHQSSPRLTHLTFNLRSESYFHAPPGICAAMSEAICRFQRLTCVSTVIPINLQALAHLSQLPSLRVLDVHLDWDVAGIDDFAPLNLIPQNQFFPHLRSITLTHQYYITPISIILFCIWSSHINTIKVSVPQLRSQYQQVMDCLSVIGHRTAPDNITYVSLNLPPDRWPLLDPVTFDEDALAPLLMLPHLTHLELELGCQFVLNNAACHMMADAWQDIQVLELGPHPEQKTTQVTLDALVSFAMLCPRLQRLSICLNADVRRLRSSPGCRPGLGCEQTALKALFVGKSPIDDPVAVAAYLSDLFPKLNHVVCSWQCEEDIPEDDLEDYTEEERATLLAESVFRTRWYDVITTFLPNFVRVRQQEREWARSNRVIVRPAPALGR